MNEIHQIRVRDTELKMNSKLHGQLSGLVIVLTLLNFSFQSLAIKIDCHPTPDASKEKCESLGCIWSPVESKTHEPFVKELSFDQATAEKLVTHKLSTKEEIQEPWCHFPEDYAGYAISQLEPNRLKLSQIHSSALPNDIRELIVDIKNFGHLINVKIYDANNKRFEPELPVLHWDQSSETGSNSKIDFRVVNGRSLQISRTSTGDILFETDLSKLIFSDKFIQLNSRLSSPFVYGLGEHYTTFLKATDRYKAFSFYNTDHIPTPGGRRSYGGFPFYVNLNSNRTMAHGVYLRNSDAMDIVLQSDQSITFRPIGGIIDLAIFGGPTAHDVVSQYQHLVGLPSLPPRWSLGFHLCRYAYKTLEETKRVWQRTRDAGIPFDVQWNDIDVMDRYNDFTYSPDRFRGLPQFIEELHNSNMHYMVLFDPGLAQEDGYYPYELGKEMDIFVKNATGGILVGKVWNQIGRTVFPDFSNNNTIEYWIKLFSKFLNEVPVDGAWLDMNDISNFVDGSLDGCPQDHQLENTPYTPVGPRLQTKSLCLSAKHRAGYEYDLHNLYAFYETIATDFALKTIRRDKRPFIISRSTHPGQGHYSGHWSGDYLSTWDYLRLSIPSLIEHSMYGFSMMGSDICGFSGNTTEELCARWSTLGAFYTFARNHNDDISRDQDPVALGQTVINANKNAFTKRYSLLPFLYTLIHRAHRLGDPAIHSVPFEFHTTDQEALKVEDQFMWGKALMISPILDPNTFSKKTYLPKGRWYETSINPQKLEYKIPKVIITGGEWVETKDIDLTDIAIFYRGGNIIPIYPNVAQTVPDTVKQPVGLEIALCSKRMADGELYLDDGDNVDGKHNYLTMNWKNNTLNIIQIKNEYTSETNFGLVRVFGFTDKIHSVEVNGEPTSFSINDHVLTFDLKSHPVSNNKPLEVKVN